MAAKLLAPRLLGVAFLAGIYIAIVLERLVDIESTGGLLAQAYTLFPLESRVLLKVAPIVSLAVQAHVLAGHADTKAAGLRRYAGDIASGLGFSIAGDALLQMDDLKAAAANGLEGAGAPVVEPSVHFLCGLGAFLVAHLIYIIAFRSRGVRGGLNVPVGIMCGVAAAAMYCVLLPSLHGVLAPAVGVYATVLATTVYAAATMSDGDATTRAAALAGALCFMLSDAILAARQLGPSWLKAAVAPCHPQTAVMVLYYAAQALIASSIRVPGGGGAAVAAPAGAPASDAAAEPSRPALPTGDDGAPADAPPTSSTKSSTLRSRGPRR